MIPRKKIQTKVYDLLRQNQIERPPTDVYRVAGSLGIKILLTKFDRDDVSGVLIRKGDDILIGVNVDHSSNRQRFTIAHEIGHFLLHMIKPIFVDQVILRFRDDVSSEGCDLEEIEANVFAAELLMPEFFILRDIGSLDIWDDESIQRLAREYDVSLQSLAYRLSNLGYSPVV